MAEAPPSGSTYEEKPKVAVFLYIASGFFVILFFAMLDMPNTLSKYMWLLIAVLNIAANTVQVINTMRTRYVLWRRGLSIYVGNNREALIRFDKALVFKQFKGHKQARNEAREYGVTTPIRSYPSFGGRRRWLVIFEREDEERQAFVFDPTPLLENSFRQRLIEADEAAAANTAPDATDEAGWTEEDAASDERTDEAARPPR